MYILFHPDVEGMELYYRKLQGLPLVAVSANICLAPIIIFCFWSRQICRNETKCSHFGVLLDFDELNRLVYNLFFYSYS